jgi:hypothetical protein
VKAYSLECVEEKFSEVRSPWVWVAYPPLYLADRPTSGTEDV